MFRRSSIAVTVALALGCAGQKAATQGAEGQEGPKEQQQRIINQGYFDLATCYPRELQLPTPVNQAGLLGLLLAARPQTVECLVDPANRGASKETTVKIAANVTEAGAQFTATGDNLTEAGAQCIQSAVQKLARVEPLPKGAQPVTAEIEVHHMTGGTLPGVVFSNNEGSDIVGKARLATSQWCECFEGWKTDPPEVLSAHLTVTKEKPAYDVTFDPATTPTGQTVVACLEPKLEALSHPITAETLKVPYKVLLLNSNNTEPPTNAEPQLEFLQFESARAQAQADVVLGGSRQQNALESYDSFVQQYKKAGTNWKLTDKLLPKVVSSCQDLLKADANLTTIYERQLQLEQRMAARTAEFGAADERWAPAVAETQNQVTATQEDLAKHKANAEARKGICPKVKK